MLQATKVSFWKNRYEISAAGRVLATWSGPIWRLAGTVELDGRRYEIRTDLWGREYTMIDTDGGTVASADRVGRKKWTVEANGQVYAFQRTSIWGQEEILHSAGRRAGFVKRINIWRGDAIADLPGLPLPVQIFVLAVALAKWDGHIAVAATAAVGGTAGAAAAIG